MKKTALRKEKTLPKRKSKTPHLKLLVTKKMLDLSKNELKKNITSLELKTRAGFKKVDSRFDGVSSRFDMIEARFHEVDARFDRIEARFHEVDARFNRLESRMDALEGRMERLEAAIFEVKALVEEQNERNKIVMDALIVAMDQVKALNQRTARVEKQVFGIEQEN